MRAPAVALLATLALGACGRDSVHSERLLAMGTWVDIAIAGGDPARADAAVREVERMLRGFERDYYAWGDGELARLNAALERAEPFAASPELAEVLRRATTYSAATSGAFDPAVGALVELWGFHSGADRDAAPVPPDAARVAAWLKQGATIGNLAVAADGTITTNGPVGKLDLGAIAKGAAVDRALAMLADAGFGNALVNAGGNLRVSGARGERAWRVGIQAPRGPGVLGVIELASGEAAITSGDYERFYDYQGRRMHHILDPATGYPVPHTQAVTVIAADATIGDAASTALLVAGPDRWREVAERLGVTLVLRVAADGEIEMTDAMRERLRITPADASDIIAGSP